MSRSPVSHSLFVLPLVRNRPPTIFQTKMSSEFGSVKDRQCATPEGPVVRVLMDDLKVSSRTYPEHARQVNVMNDRACEIGAQFGVRKCLFAAEAGEFWGFDVSSEGRRPARGKIDQLNAWPDYECIEDVKSHVHFAEYLKEFIPILPDIIFPLRPYLKKGAQLEESFQDEQAKQAKKALTEAVVSNCALVKPDFEADRHPFESKRPFEIFSDASDYGWCCVLTQRDREGGAPRIIAADQMRWSTFEGEFFS